MKPGVMEFGLKRENVESCRMWNLWLMIGALSGLVSVAAGAFAAHGLKGKLAADDLAVFETAARYQMYHALALLAVAWLAESRRGWTIDAAGWCFVGGTVLFSGSLYILALSGVRWLGAVTPFGGVAFLIGWACMAAAVGAKPEQV